MELIALSGIALLTAILVSRAVGTATIQWAYEIYTVSDRSDSGLDPDERGKKSS